MDFRGALYFIGVILMLAMRLTATEWAEDLHIFYFLAFIAGLLGLLLGYSRFSLWLSGIIGSLYATVTIPWLFSQTLSSRISFYDRIVNFLWFRLRFTFGQYIASEPITDTILFVFILSVLIWLICSIGGFFLTRKGAAWIAVLLPGIALIIISYYDFQASQTSNHLLFFLAFSLLLIGRYHLLTQLHDWKKGKIIPTPQVKQTLQRTLLSFTIIVLLITWLIPLSTNEFEGYSKFWEKIAKPFKQLQDRLSRIVEPVEYEEIEKSLDFGLSLNLGNVAATGEEILFHVTSSQNSGWEMPNYWKAQTYDSYRDGQWALSNNYDSIDLFPQNFNLNQSIPLSREEITYAFDMNIFLNRNIFTVNFPVWISRGVEVNTISIENNFREAISYQANPPLQKGEIYQVRALVANPTWAELRAAEQDYPAWLDRYLQLPEDLSPKIKQLAEEIAAYQNNSFDKTQVITYYLRRNITYSERIPEVPEGEDPIAWFLFTHKAGYCNYYATAEVLMLRSIGIPARLAVGYAQGSFNPENGSFTVVQKDRHAWVEVYYVGYGWVEFEPTSSRPYIERPLGQVNLPTPAPTIEPEEIFTPPPTTSTPTPQITPTYQGSQGIDTSTIKKDRGPVFWAWLGILLLTILTSAIVSWFSIPQYRITPPAVLLYQYLKAKGQTIPTWLENSAKKQMQIPIKRAYSSIVKGLKSLDQEVKPADTPYELGQKLIKNIPELKEQVLELVHQVEVAKFSPHSADIYKANECRMIIQKTIAAHLIEKRLRRKMQI